MNPTTYPTEAIPPLMPTFTQPVPDERKLAFKLAGGWAVHIIAPILFLVGVGLLLGVAFMLYRDHQYRSSGTTADGTVIDTRISTSTNSKGRRSTTYYATYAFVDGQGRRYQDEENVGADFYSTLFHGKPWPVEYLPSDPAVSRLKRDRGAAAQWVMGSIGVVLVVLAGLMLFGNRRAGQRRAAVVFRGQARPGQVVVSEQQGKGKNRRYVLNYRYVDLVGQEQLSKDVTVSSKVMNQFPRGTVITVLIDPNSPAKPEPDLYGVRPLPQM
jgi:hypothetical protein